MYPLFDAYFKKSAVWSAVACIVSCCLYFSTHLMLQFMPLHLMMMVMMQMMVVQNMRGCIWTQRISTGGQSAVMRGVSTAVAPPIQVPGDAMG